MAGRSLTKFATDWSVTLLSVITSTKVISSSRLGLSEKVTTSYHSDKQSKSLLRI